MTQAAETRTIEVDGYDTEQTDAIQRRTIGVLGVSSMFSRGATSIGFVAGALAIKDLLGEDRLEWAGLSTTASTVGSALAAAWLAMLMQRRGRTLGLAAGLAIAIIGTVLGVIALEARIIPLLLAGMMLVGVGSGTSALSRYAAADLATPERRSRDLSMVVFASTVGAVGFPLLLGTATSAAEDVGLNKNAGGFILGSLLFMLASASIWFLLRPDPLVMIGGVSSKAERKRRPVSFSEAVRIVWAHPLARLAFFALVISQAVMVSVMAMTPLHMEDHGHSDGWVGAVISAHTAGMFAFAPLAGWVSDRAGRVKTIVAAGSLLIFATILTSLAGEAPRLLMFPGLFLLGLGWSFGFVAGSALLTESVDEHERVAAQGAADLATNIASGAGALGAGVVLSSAGYHILSLVGMAAAGALVAQSWFENRLATGAAA